MDSRRQFIDEFRFRGEMPNISSDRSFRSAKRKSSKKVATIRQCFLEFLPIFIHTTVFNGAANSDSEKNHLDKRRKKVKSLEFIWIELKIRKLTFI